MRFLTALILIGFLFALLIPMPVLAGLDDLKDDLRTRDILGRERSTPGATDAGTTQAPPVPPADPLSPPANPGNPDCPGDNCPPTDSDTPDCPPGSDVGITGGSSTAHGLGRIFGGFLKGIFRFFETLFKGIFGGLQDIFGGGQPPVAEPPRPSTPEPPATPPVDPPSTPTAEPPAQPPTTPPVQPPATPPVQSEPPRPKPQGVQRLEPGNFDNAVLQHKGVYLVDFYAEWCGYCKQLAPQLESAAHAFASDPAVQIGKVDAHTHAQLRARYGVNGYPTMIIFKDGKPVSKFSGYRSASELQRIVNQYK